MNKTVTMNETTTLKPAPKGARELKQTLNQLLVDEFGSDKLQIVNNRVVLKK